MGLWNGSYSLLVMNDSIIPMGRVAWLEKGEACMYALSDAHGDSGRVFACIRMYDGGV